MAIKSSIIISAKNRTDGAFGAVKRGLGGVASKATFAVGAVAGLAGAAGFGALVAKSFETGDALAKTADKLDITTKKLAALQHLGELTGVSNEKMNSSLERMVKRLGEAASGTGEARQWLDKLNLSAESLVNLSADQQYAAIADAISGMSTQAEKAAATAGLFGREGVALVNTLNQGADGFARAEEEAELFGLALSRVDAAKIERANDETTRLKGIVKGAGNSFAVELAPYITGVNEQIVKMAKDAGGFGEIAASAIDGLVTGLGFAADAVRGLQAVWEGLKVGVAGYINFAVSGLNELQNRIVDVANSIPGIDIEPLEGLAEAAFITNEAFERTKRDFKALVDQPMPSENFKAWAEEVKASANEAAMAVAAASPSADNGITPPPGMEGAGGEETEDPEIQKMRERLVKLDESLLAEKERLALHYEEKQEFLQEAFENEVITEAERDARLQALAADHESKLNKIKNKGLSDRQKFEQMSMKQQTKFVLGELSSILAGAAQSNKTLFKINKIAGIANAIVSTSEGVAKSLAAYPYPINIGMAAATFAAGIAQVNAIRSQQFGGGGAVPSPSGGGGASASSGQAAVQQALATNQQTTAAATETTTETPAAAPTQTINVNLGDDDELVSVAAMRRFIERMEDVRADMGGNARLVVS